MQDMSDNELDNLFKEAAEGFTPPPDPSAWKQMASMLDKTPLKPAGFWNWKTISGITATGLIAVTAIWFGVRNEDAGNTKTTGQYGYNNATQGVVQEQKEQSNPTGDENLAEAKSLENKSTHPGAVGAGAGKDDKPASASGKVQHQQSQRLKNLSVNNELSDASDDSGQSSRIAHNEASQALQQLATTTSASLPVADDKVLVRGQSESERSMVPAAIVKPDSVNQTGEPAAADSVQNEGPKEEHKHKNGAMRLSVKATVSPDFSSINFFSAGKTGINYGLLAGLSFNNRWSVYTGVISSRKLYDTKDVSGNYTFDGHDYSMKEIDGDCRIIDIPLNVYYTFFPDRSFSLRAGVGFSSYIMQTENYRYLVDYYGNDVYYRKNVEGKNKEWFKMMNISLLVSKRLSNRLSAEFEPFVKAPLAGVGEGKVSLVSMGAFINLKYDLLILK